eukprot:jgi/Mesvir1/1691/Mv21152-RA.2
MRSRKELRTSQTRLSVHVPRAARCMKRELWHLLALGSRGCTQQRPSSCTPFTGRKRNPSAGGGQQSMEAGLKLAVEAIHASPVRSVIFVAGGGSQALSWLLSTPGASDTVLEATVPYCRDSLAGIIGHEPEQYVSATTAREMAAAAYRRAVRLSTSGTPLAGVACTCALTSVVPKKGAHRCMVAAHTHKGLFEYGISLEKGRRSRFEEDGMASRLVLKALADACAVTVPVDLMLEHPGDVLTQSRHDHMDAVEGLLQGTYSTVQFDGPDVLLDAVRGHCFLPGSFNPVHRGHLRLLEIAARKAGQPACFELSVINADKPPLAREACPSS